MANNEIVYEMRRKLCEEIENKRNKDINDIVHTICKVEKSGVATFEEALESSKITITMHRKIKEEMAKKWEKGLPVYITDRELPIPSKGEMSEKINCDINRIIHVRDIVEEINRLKSIENSVECRK